MDSVRALLAGTRVADPLERDAALAQVTQGLFARASVPPTIGRYHVLERLGGGGQGVVHAAWDPELGRRVAIKVLRIGTPDEEATARLRREAMALAQLSDPHVIAVNDVGTCPAGVFVVMQLVAGRTLSQWLAHPRPWREVVDVLAQAGRGLAAAHGRGILHRDFKPSNVWIGDDGVVRLLDFGLAQLADAAPDTTSAEDTLTRGSNLTAVGHVMGTPAYMAPEQHEGAPLGPATDQYAYCVTLFEALYGERPWAGPTLEALATAKRDAILPRRPRGSQVPDRVRAIVARGLHPDPAGRWSTMAALVEALGRAASPRPRTRLALAAGGVLALSIVGAWSLRGPVAPACADDGALAEIWSGSRRSAIATAFGQTGSSLAREATDAILDDVDDFSRRWIATRDEACVALPLDPFAGGRMRCLDRARDELDDTLGILENASGRVVEHADELVRGLPDPEACGSVDVPSPDPEAHVVRREIARARAMGVAGHAGVATDAARRALARAQALKDDALTAEAELVHGTLLLDSGEIVAAAAELERAYLSAVGIDRDRLAFDAALALTSLYASHRQDLEACRLWVDRAAAALERDASRSDPSRRGRLALARAKQHFSAGEHADALPHARDAARLLEDADDPAASGAIDVLAKLLANLGSHDEALAEARRAIEVARRTRGASHPAAAAALTTYAAMRSGPDHAGDALESLQEALAIYRDVRGDDDLAVAEVRRRMGNAHAQLGRKEDAARLYREALEAQRRVLPADDTKIAQTLYSLSTAVRALGDLKEAESLGREALRIAEATIGEEHFTTVIYVHGLAETLLASEPETAAEMLERGRRIVARRLGEEHHLHAAFLTSLGKYARGRGDLDRARQQLEASLAIHDGPARGVDPEAREETSRELAGVVAALEGSPEGAGT